MKVSIGVPIYNVSSYLEVCLRSLLEQTYDNIEYIFVNDCSTDDSMAVYEKVVSQYPSRADSIKLIHNKHNSGLASTRNVALENATGEYIIWVDSDDYVDTQMVEKFVAAQEKTQADIITCNSIVEFPNGTGINESPIYTSPKQMTLTLLRHKEGTPVCVWARFIRRSLYMDNNIRALDGVNNGEDFQVTPRLSYYASKVSSIPDYLYYYNKNNPSAYTYTFSVKQMNGTWKSLLFLESFFNGKGEDYLHAIGVAKADAVSHDMVGACLYGDKMIFDEVASRRSSLDKRCILELPFKFRTILSFSNYKILSPILKLLSVIKSIFRK